MSWLTRRSFAGRLWERALLSSAKHPSLAGHPRIAHWLARTLPGYVLDEDAWCGVDGAPPDVVAQRRRGVARLAEALRGGSPRTLAATREVADVVSDVAFTSRYRVPFPFHAAVARALPVGAFVGSSDGVRLRDLDGRESYDVAGSYGTNVFGIEFYKRSLARAYERAAPLGPVLGPYHPVVADNAARLRALSGLDEVTFHMSGTEAVMQAVRLARYHTGRRFVVRFAGAYHGWGDGVQVGPGNPRQSRDVLTLAELGPRSIDVLRTRRDVACVLVNPLQALSPNASAPADSALLTGRRRARYDRDLYAGWLRDLRAVCAERDVPLIFDEVFTGFRLARGGAQEYFGVAADLVTYGKTLGGGLPVGVVCGSRRFMRRYRDDRPGDVCLARGTFNAHPYVMTAMNEVLRYVDTPEARATWQEIDARWDARAAQLNRALTEARVPVRVANMTSVFVTTFTEPGRYHWMLQYYLRAAGLALPWTGAARMIFSHDYTDADFAEVTRRFAAAARAMSDDGWFWSGPRLTAGRLAAQILREGIGAALGPLTTDVELVDGVDDEPPPSSSADRAAMAVAE